VTVTPRNNFTGEIQLEAAAQGIQARFGSPRLTLSSPVQTVLTLTPDFATGGGGTYPIVVRALDSNGRLVRTRTYDLSLILNRPVGFATHHTVYRNAWVEMPLPPPPPPCPTPVPIFEVYGGRYVHIFLQHVVGGVFGYTGPELSGSRVIMDVTVDVPRDTEVKVILRYERSTPPIPYGSWFIDDNTLTTELPRLARDGRVANWFTWTFWLVLGDCIRGETARRVLDFVRAHGVRSEHTALTTATIPVEFTIYYLSSDGKWAVAGQTTYTIAIVRGIF
jgi:hypothetical protein